MTDPNVETLTKDAIIAKSGGDAAKAVREMFTALHPAPGDAVLFAAEATGIDMTRPLAPEQVEGRPVIDSGSWRARRKETAA